MAFSVWVASRVRCLGVQTGLRVELAFWWRQIHHLVRSPEIHSFEEGQVVQEGVHQCHHEPLPMTAPGDFTSTVNPLRDRASSSGHQTASEASQQS
jgi:hypothetical protein